MARPSRRSTSSGRPPHVPTRPSRKAFASGVLGCALALATIAFLGFSVGCQSTDSAPQGAGTALPTPDVERPTEDAGVGRGSDAATSETGTSHGGSNLRIMAANISSGDSSTYDDGEGMRMFQGLRPDVALVQELRYKSNTADDLRGFVAEAFGSEFSYYAEPEAQIPNAVITRYPILESGQWDDPEVSNRSFAWAKIAVPGPHSLWAVSVHLLTTGSSIRNIEARTLVDALKSVVADDDYVVIGGDFNTDGRGEACLATLGELVVTRAPFPADQRGNDDTNANRNKPYDWVVADRKLGALQVPTTVGPSSFPAGLVFDSRVFQPLAAATPVQTNDSDAVNMQHMPVVKDFHLPD